MLYQRWYPFWIKKKEIGCHDKTPPTESRKGELPYMLYFAKERSKWGRGGVAFIGHEKAKNETIIGRMYLITDKQFSEVVAQENKKDGLDIDLGSVITNGYQKIDDGWYGTIIYLGDKEGSPMFTFTSNNPNSEMFIKPSPAYLSTIANGLLELGMSKEDIINYFFDKKGIQGHFPKESLFSYMF